MKLAHEAMTPGAEHKQLEMLVGEWTTSSKFWMTPDSKPEVSKGSASHTLILGKRFIQEKYRGKWLNLPYEGFGLIGYDKAKKAYVSVWLDNMGTSMMSSEGSFNQANNSLDMNTEYSCPVSGSTTKGRAVSRFISKNEYVYEMYGPDMSGKEFKMMEIVYKRKK
jgi:hypothetical protein